MRHRIGVILAVVMTGVLFFVGAWGYLRLLRFPAPLDQFSQLPAQGGSLVPHHSVLTALAAIAGTGLLAGILIAWPGISPLAAGLPGLGLLGWTGLYLVNVRQAVDLIPLRSDPFGAGFEAMMFNGVLAAAGLAMIIPMFVPSRWRTGAELDEFIPNLGGTTDKPPQTLPALTGQDTAPGTVGVPSESAATWSAALRMSPSSPATLDGDR